LLLLVLIVAMLLGIIGPKLVSPGKWEHQFKVGLGLDLSSGTQVTLQALTDNKKAPSADEMNAAVSVIQSRVNGTGNSGAQVQPQGDSLLVVTVPGKGSAQTIQLVESTALLMFRQVLLFEPYGATSTTTPAVSPSASPSASASGSASPSATGSAQASPSASSTSTAKTSAKIVPAATSSPSPSTSASAKASGSASPSASASASPSPSASSSASATTFGNASLVTQKGVMALFNKLVCKPGDTQKWKAQVGYDQGVPTYNHPRQAGRGLRRQRRRVGQVHPGRGQGAG
jgi:preprotein translocase subunit SecD